MEEEQSMEWNEIEEEEENKPSRESKLSLIWNRGWRIGKKIMITGVVFSSAPFVLPPLMVVSTIGFAFAVPFGFVFGTYACTDKIMSKLLSRPNPPPLLMLQPKIQEEEEEEEGEESMDLGEKEFINDTKDSLEMRFELTDEDENIAETNESFDVEEKIRDHATLDNYVETSLIEPQVDIEGKIGDEGKVDETLEDEERPLMDDIGEDKEHVGETRQAIEEIEDEEDVGKALEDEQKIVEANVDDIEGDDEKMNGVEESRGEENGMETMEEEKIEEEEEKIEEEEKTVSETNEVGEEGRDEKNGVTMVEENDIPVKDMEGDVGIEVRDKRFNAVNEEREVPLAKSERIVEETKDGTLLDENSTKDERNLEDIERIAVEMCDEQDVYDFPREETYIVIEEKPVVDKNGVVDEHLGDVVEDNLDNDKEVKRFEERGLIEESVGDENVGKGIEVDDTPMEDKSMGEGMKNVGKDIEEEDIPIEDKSMGEAMKIAKERRDHGSVGSALNEEEKTIEEIDGRFEDKKDSENMINREAKKAIVEKEKEIIFSKDDSREIADESGLYFFDDDNEDRYSAEYIEKGHLSDDLRRETADPVTHPVPSEIVQSDKRSVVDKNTTDLSKEVLYTEGKIWEQIDALRKIVGYKADVQATCLEELKALYVFTGVEPPPLPSNDLAQVNKKLRLLMSIVGVK